MADPAGRVGRRLRRLLVMVPHVIENPGVTVDELARKFGVRRDDILADLRLVWMCGLPNYDPLALIDVVIEGDRVTINMADYLSAPLRVTSSEALALYVAGRTVASLPGMEEADALRRALEKIERALGGTAGGIEVLLEAGPTAHLEVLQEALNSRRRVRLEYMSATTGELTTRDVDPWALIASLGHWYLVGYDHLRDDDRMFRTDRIKSVELLDEPASRPQDFDPGAYRGAFSGGQGIELELEISPRTAQWFEDYYPVRSVMLLDDGWSRVRLTAGGLRWAAVLVVRLGRDARAVRPAEVVDEARRLVEAVARLYAD